MDEKVLAELAIQALEQEKLNIDANIREIREKYDLPSRRRRSPRRKKAQPGSTRSK